MFGPRIVLPQEPSPSSNSFRNNIILRNNQSYLMEKNIKEDWRICCHRRMLHDLDHENHEVIGSDVGTEEQQEVCGGEMTCPRSHSWMWSKDESLGLSSSHSLLLFHCFLSGPCLVVAVHALPAPI